MSAFTTKQDEAIKETFRYIALAHELWPLIEDDLEYPLVTFDLKGRTAGTANYRDNIIQYNNDMLENEEGFIQGTVGHEVAHLIHKALIARGMAKEYKKPHGNEWKRIMRLIGCSPERLHKYHGYQTKTVTRRKYRYYCPQCSKTFDVGIKRHTKQQYYLSIATNQGYFCPKCKKQIQYKGQIQ